MPAFKPNIRPVVNLNDTAEIYPIRVQGDSRVSIQLVLASGSWGTAEVEVFESNDGNTPVGTAAGSFTASGAIVSVADIDHDFIILKVKTAAGVAGTAAIHESHHKNN